MPQHTYLLAYLLACSAIQWLEFLILNHSVTHHGIADKCSRRRPLRETRGGRRSFLHTRRIYSILWRSMVRERASTCRNTDDYRLYVHPIVPRLLSKVDIVSFPYGYRAHGEQYCLRARTSVVKPVSRVDCMRCYSGSVLHGLRS